MYQVGTIEADNIIEACKLAPALHPEVKYFKVDGPVRGETFSVEFPSDERGNFDELRDLLQI